jgi:site-specific DNA-methyltransferase (adenine-specific)
MARPDLVRRGSGSSADDLGDRAGAPVVRTALGALHGGDALEFLRTQPSGEAALVFADPPYNAGRERWDSFASTADYLTWSDRWIAEAARLLRPGGSLYLCGFSEALADLKAVAAPRFASCRWLVWYYRNKANLGNDWGRAHESILHLRKEGFRLAVDAARVPYNAHTVKYPAHPQADSSRYGGARYVWQPHPLGAKPRDVIEIPTLANGMAEKTAHPTQKPLELVRRLVAAASAPGELVIDPFGGSGTTYVVCETLGRRWRGCELEPEYQALIVKRLAAPARAELKDAPKHESRRRRQRERLR